MIIQHNGAVCDDRWHSWHNLAEYENKAVTQHRGCLLAAGHGAEADDEEAGTGRGAASVVPPDAFLDEGGPPPAA